MTALDQLRTLRNEIKERESLINTISDQATREALDILSQNGKDRGEFELNGHKYQLQRNDVFDLSNYNRYKDEEAKRWREKKAAQEQAKKYTAALTKEMKGIVDGFVATHPDWEPDEIKLTVKCV